MNIKINEPCHENWDAMTPNKQGAFCKSCVKDVVDFSKKSIEEIKDFFSKPQDEKVCGRFEEKQLQELSFDDFFAKFRYWNFGKKFAVIFFLAFGFWIFSNSSATAQTMHMKGEVAIIREQPVEVKKDTVKKHMDPPVHTKKMMMGKVSRKVCEPTPVVVDSVAPSKVVQEPMIMGAVAYRPVVKTVNEEVPPTNIAPVKDSAAILSQIIQIELINPEPDQTLTIDTVANVERTVENKDAVIIYPNPGNGNFILETKTDEKQTVYMIDETGKLVLAKKISGSATMDASALPAGTYNVHIINDATGNVIRKRLIIVR